MSEHRSTSARHEVEHIGIIARAIVCAMVAAMPTFAASSAAASTVVELSGARAIEARAIDARESTTLVISAVFADGYAPRDADEAVQLWNVGETAVDLGGWSVRDESGSAVFPPADAANPTLPAGEFIWITRDAAPFARSFGHAPDYAWGDPVLADGTSVGAMSVPGRQPTLANTGDVIYVVDASGGVVDTVVYGDEDGDAVEGWVGPAVDAYHPGAIGGANQILYRALDPESGQPIGDTDGAAGWASDPGDAVHGRRARFPGWDLEAVLVEAWRFEEDAGLEVAVAPDGLFEFLDRHLASARSSVDLFAYTFGHPVLAERLAERARAGVTVRVLVDGAPAGGHDPTGRWCLNHLAEAGADVRFMDSADGIKARYRSQHAKLIVIDRRMVLVGTENPTLGSAPVDGTAGRRGVWIATDAPSVIEWAERLIQRDFDPAAHVDLRPFQPRDPTRGAPAPDFEPAREGGGPGNMPRWSETLHVEGTFDIETISAPEMTRRAERGVLGLLARAGPGASVRVAQLREPLWWGYGESEGEIARNPRLAAYLEAARRGARVRVMFDGYFDDAEHRNSNSAAAAWLRERAAAEGLDLDARTANPSGRALHAKMILVDAGESALPVPPGDRVDPGDRPDRADRADPADRADRADLADRTEPQRWIHVGSINGTEVASLVNREVALTIRSAAAHDRLAAVFDDDFVRGYHPVWLPWVGRPW